MLHTAIIIRHHLLVIKQSNPCATLADCLDKCIKNYLILISYIISKILIYFKKKPAVWGFITHAGKNASII